MEWFRRLSKPEGRGSWTNRRAKLVWPLQAAVTTAAALAATPPLTPLVASAAAGELGTEQKERANSNAGESSEAHQEIAKELLQITAKRQRGGTAPERQVIASVGASATVAGDNNSVDSISDALLSPLVAPAAAAETRAEQEDRPERHAINRSGLVLEEPERKWRRICWEEATSSTTHLRTRR